MVGLWWGLMAQYVVTMFCQMQASDCNMEIPDELRNLLAELKRVTTNVGEAGSRDYRPSTSDIDQFLSQYRFDEDVVIEWIEITHDGMFQFYLFAAWQPKIKELGLFQMTK
jgi:hypothetical protein